VGPWDVDAAKIVLLSDVHKGSRDGADDFRRCERVYDAALAWYFENGFWLGVLGDAEDLWECGPGEILPRDERRNPRRQDGYWHALELEAAFHQAGRLIRIYGNHDDLWASERQVDKHLGPLFGHDPNGEKLRVWRAARIALTDAGQSVGTLVLTHGNQGSFESDVMAPVSHLFLRTVFRPLQRRVGFSTVTPAENWALRKPQDLHLRAWANGHPDHPVLIAGHTHQPIFGECRPDPAEARLEPKNEAERRAAEEFTRADRRRLAGITPELPNDPPCYFNTGSCAFGDGEISVLEVADSEIRLVRWSPWAAVLAKDEQAAPKAMRCPGPYREVLDGAHMVLRDVLARVAGRAPVQEPTQV
jgi:hypothetical protein